MIRLASSSQRLPPSLYVNGVEVDTITEPAACGSFSDVFKGRCLGRLVALKRIRERDPGDQRRKEAFEVACSSSGLYHPSERATNPQKVAQQAIIWRQLKHNNIIPFIGVDQLTFVGDLCLVAPWMGRGTLRQYTRSDEFKRSRDAHRVVRF
jgi:serine/threonine protein kinase